MPGYGGGGYGGSISWPLILSSDETFRPNAIANNALTLHNEASAINGIQINGTASGTGPKIAAVGSTNLDLQLFAAGTGIIRARGPGAFTSDGAILAGYTLANPIQFQGSNTGQPVTIQPAAGGSDTNVGVNIITKGTGVFTVNGSAVGAASPLTLTAHNDAEVPIVVQGAADNGQTADLAQWWTSATGTQGMSIDSFGSIHLGQSRRLNFDGGANAGGIRSTNGALITFTNATGNFGDAIDGDIQVSGGSSAANAVRLGAFAGGANSSVAIYGVTNAVNRWAMKGSATTAKVLIAPEGSDTNISGDISGKGTGTITINGVVPSGGLLAVKEYGPGGGHTYNTGATLTALDTTNLAVTFTAPASGKVVVVLDAIGSLLTGALVFGLLNASGGAQVGSRQWATFGNVVIGRSTTYHLVTGLTAGTSYTFQWAGQSVSSTGNVYMGDDTDVANTGGPGKMMVFSA